MEYIIITFIFFFALRLVSLSFSIRNEKLLQKKEQNNMVNSTRFC